MTPVDEAPPDMTPVHEAPPDETPVDEAPPEQAPLEGKPAGEPPVAARENGAGPGSAPWTRWMRAARSSARRTSAAGITARSLCRAARAAWWNGVPSRRCRATAIATASAGVMFSGGRVWERSRA